MSTRGLVGHIINGEKYGLYNHADSYPEGLGVDVVNFLRAGTIELLRERLSRYDYKRPNRTLSLGSEALETYCDMVQAEALKQAELQASDWDFIDNFSCQYAYIMNFDEERLEYKDHDNDDKWVMINFSEIIKPEIEPISLFI